MNPYPFITFNIFVIVITGFTWCYDSKYRLLYPDWSTNHALNSICILHPVLNCRALKLQPITRSHSTVLVTIRYDHNHKIVGQ